MAQSVKLVRGSQYIELNASPYAIGFDFAPPAINREYNITSGTSANVSGGGEAVSFVNHDRQFSFTVRLLNSTMDAAKMNMRRITKFIEQRTSDPFYLEYRENSSIPVPLWGQFGAPLRYEIVTAAVGSISVEYTTVPDGKGFTVTISLEVKPLATGNKQKLINASGGVFENNYGSADGSSKGLSIFEACTNKMTNPAFTHATYDNGWTMSANVIISKNTDPAYCLPGLAQSAKLMCNGASTVAYQSINAGNTNKHSFSAYLFLPDFGTPTASDAQLYYNALLTTTFQNLGNGLWLAYSDNVDGINSAQATGISVKTGRTIYLCAFQMEEKAYHTPITYGDLLGCAWTATAHASTSTRTACNLNMARDDSIISLAQGGITVVWKPYYSNTFGANEVLFGLYKSDFAANGLVGQFLAADDKFYLTDGTNTISTAAQTFAGGDTLYLEFTWGPTGLNIYKNGVNAATGATYTPAILANQAVLSIGQNNAGTPCNGDLLAFDIYPTELSTAQALAIYTAQASVIAAGGRPSLIPWLYSSAGTGVVDNCTDSTHKNWVVAGGIGGSADAETTIIGTLSATAGQDAVIISKCVTDTFYNPSSRLLWDESGTAAAGDCGGEHLVTTVNTNLVAISAAHVLDAGANKLLEGNDFVLVGRLKDAGDNLTVLASWADHDSIATSQPFPGTTGALMVSKSDRLTQMNAGAKTTGTVKYYTLTVKGQRTISGSADVGLDWVGLFPKPFMQIGIRTTGESFIYNSTASVVNEYDVGTNVSVANRSLTGYVVELTPSRYNILLSAIGRTYYGMTIADTLTYSIVVAPRYTLA